MAKAPRPEIKKVGIKHDHILNWLIEFPERPAADCAEYFGVTRAWLSVIMNSDAFKERLKMRQDQVFHATLCSLRVKLEGVAHAALDRLGDKIETIDDADFLLETADRTLSRLGYGTGKTAPVSQQVQQQNIVMLDSETLSSARSLMDKARALRLQPAAIQEISHDVIPEPEPEPCRSESPSVGVGPPVCTESGDQ